MCVICLVILMFLLSISITMGVTFFWRISTTLQWPCGQNAGDIWRFLKMGETPKTIGFNTKMDWFWMICGGPIWGNPPYDDILWYMVVSKNDGSKSVHLPWENMRKPMLLGYAVAKLPSLAGWSHAPRQLQFFVIVQVCYDAEWRNSLPAKCVHIYRYTVCLYVYIYIYYGVAIKIVEDHCSIAEALLSEVCTKHCRAIGPAPKATMAQNTGKRYGPKKSDNHDHSNCLDETDVDGNLYIYIQYIRIIHT